MHNEQMPKIYNNAMYEIRKYFKSLRKWCNV